MHHPPETLVLRDLACLLFIPLCFAAVIQWSWCSMLIRQLREQEQYTKRWFRECQHARRDVNELLGIEE